MTELFAPSQSAAARDVEQRVRTVLSECGRLVVPADELASDADLATAGLTSHGSVSVMLSLEDEFGVEFPEELLRKSTFATIRSITAAIASLLPV